MTVDPLMRKSIAMVVTIHDELAAHLRDLNPAALAAVDAAHPLPKPFLKQRPLVARVHALRAALKPASAGGSAPPVTTAAKASLPKCYSLPAAVAATTGKPVAPAAPGLETETLERLAEEVFGQGALPKLDGKSDAEKRAVLASEFWHAHLRVPGASVSDAEAEKKHWHRPQLSGVTATIARVRQDRVNAALNLPAVSPPTVTRADFDKLSAAEKSRFCREGGRLTD